MDTYYVRRVLAHTISRLIYHLPQEIDICTQAVCCQIVYINSGHVTWFNLERSDVKLKEINLWVSKFKVYFREKDRYWYRSCTTPLRGAKALRVVYRYLHTCLFYNNKSKMIVGLLVNGCSVCCFYSNKLFWLIFIISSISTGESKLESLCLNFMLPALEHNMLEPFCVTWGKICKKNFSCFTIYYD